MKRYFKLYGKVERIIKIYAFLFGILSMLLILACHMTTDTVKFNVKQSVNKMKNEGVYPQYMANNSYYQLDNWTEAEVLNFIYSDYEGDSIRTAFAQRSLGGEIEGKRVESSYERLIARVNTEEEIDEHVRTPYWIGSRIILIPLLNIMDYYQIRKLFFCIGIVLLSVTVVLTCKKGDIKLGGGFLGTFLLINFPIAFLNNSLGMLCMYLTCAGVIYLLYHRDTQLFEFMFVVGMLTAFFEWFSLSLFSFGIMACVIVVMQYLEKNDTKFSVFFNQIWNSAAGWVLGISTMFLGRILISFLVVGQSSVNSFINRVIYNTGSQGGEVSLLKKIVWSIVYCIGGVFPISVTVESKRLIALMAIFIAIILLLLVKKRSKNIGFNCILLLIAVSPIIWIAVFNTYYYVHYWIAYRVVGISVFAVLCILFFGLDFRGRYSETWVK